MKNFILRLLMWIYINLIRFWLSPLLYWIFRYTKYKGRELPDKWDDIKDFEINYFHNEIALRSAYDYLSDPLGGVVDFSPREKNFFFLERKTSRDCDNWARMWWWYFNHHDIPAREIAILNTGQLFGGGGLRAHKVTVAQTGENGEWQLFDYRPIPDKEKTIGEVLKHNVVGYKEFVWVTGRELLLKK